MPISKGERFDVFRRDSFTCRYCGRRPPDVVLEVDHIQPRSKGGTDEPLNLVSSCFDCNRGKATKELDASAPRPDADLEYLALEQEAAEVRRYLGAKQQRDHLITQVIDALSVLWEDEMPGWVPDEAQFKGWLFRYSAEEIDYAIRAAGPKARGGYLGGTGGTPAFIQYVSGILKQARLDQKRHDDVG